MKFEFFKWSNGEWTAKHRDSNKLGWGKTKLAAALHLRSQCDMILATR